MDWLLCVVTLAQVWLVGNRRLSGMVLGVLVNIGWGILGLVTHMGGLAAVSFIIAAMYVRNFFKWRQH